ncbi:hypothetical protein [Halobacterium wangiae]|uniref:hypothetical protein n=1 Tax=Halobacterium wangiae TaxID=2902623 RepID=UPI001E3092F9|nr:hypothetical protein [Halobacterium wangiae]
MPSLLARASRLAGRVSEYAVVPAVLTLFAFGKVAAAIDPSNVGVNVKFALPTDVATLWTVVDPPAQGVTLHSPTPLLFVPIFLVVEAAVVAGYLGGIRDAHRDRDPDFLAAVEDHWLSILGVRVVQFLLFGGLAIVLLAGGAGVLVVVGLPLVFVLGYLLWAAPYLVVLRGSDALTALAESATLALDGGDYLAFSAAYAVVVAVASVVLSPLVTSAGVVGVLVGTVLVAYPSLVGSAAATIVVDDVASAASRGA